MTARTRTAVTAHDATLVEIEGDQSLGAAWQLHAVIDLGSVTPRRRAASRRTPERRAALDARRSYATRRRASGTARRSAHVRERADPPPRAPPSPATPDRANRAAAPAIPPLRLADDVELAAAIEQQPDMAHRFEPGAELRSRLAHALGDGAHLAVLRGQQHDDAVRLTAACTCAAPPRCRGTAGSRLDAPETTMTRGELGAATWTCLPSSSSDVVVDEHQLGVCQFPHERWRQRSSGPRTITRSGSASAGAYRTAETDSSLTGIAGIEVGHRRGESRPARRRWARRSPCNGVPRTPRCAGGDRVSTAVTAGGVGKQRQPRRTFCGDGTRRACRSALPAFVAELSPLDESSADDHHMPQDPPTGGGAVFRSDGSTWARCHPRTSPNADWGFG